MPTIISHTKSLGRENRSIPKTHKTVAVIGLGYVGLPLALLADKKGYNVIGVDTDVQKIQLLGQRISPFADERIALALQKSKIQPTSNFEKIRDTSLIIVCVPTPVYENHMPNLEFIKSACEAIAPFLQKDQLVILESTINPGVSEEVVLPILERGSGLKGGQNFFLAHCPERVNPGDRNWNVENIPRVLGSLEEVGLKLALDFYEEILLADIKSMGSIREAEAVKVLENSFRDINIALVNELAMSFSLLDIDIVSVIEGATTKPFSFMPHYPGCGVGGHCIPVDPYYMIEHGKKNGFYHDFLSLARRINNEMPRFTVDKVMEGLNEKKIAINGTKVAVLGLAYKSEIDDCRESPSFEVIKHLERHGADVVAYDPFVPSRSTVLTLDEAVAGAGAVVVTTPHNVFCALEPEYLLDKGVSVVVDGRNCLSKEKFLEAGIIYKGIGR